MNVYQFMRFFLINFAIVNISNSLFKYFYNMETNYKIILISFIITTVIIYIIFYNYITINIIKLIKWLDNRRNEICGIKS